MALIPQDATSPVNNANSYLSLVDARALAEQYAITLPTDDTEAETSLINGFAYIEAREPDMCGTRATDTQNTSYPREGVYIRCVLQPSSPFPNELLLSQIIAAESFGQGNNLWGGADNGRAVSKEKVDVLEVAYFDNGTTGDALTLPRFENTIQPLLCGSTSANQFKVFRG